MAHPARLFRLSLDYHRKLPQGPSVLSPAAPRAPKQIAQNACARLLNTCPRPPLALSYRKPRSATPGIPSRTCCAGDWARGFSCSFARPHHSSPAACADRIADELSRSKLIRGLLPEPMTMCVTPVLPSPSARHYSLRKRAPRDLAMSHAASPSEYRRRAKRYAVLRGWPLSTAPGKLICDLAGLWAVSLSALPLRVVLPCLAAICRALPGLLLSCLTWQPVPRFAPGASAQLSPLSSFDLPLPEIHSLPVLRPSGGLAGGVALPLLIPAALSRPSRLAMSAPLYITYKLIDERLSDDTGLMVSEGVRRPALGSLRWGSPWCCCFSVVC
jgi:hypothetical protein